MKVMQRQAHSGKVEVAMKQAEVAQASYPIHAPAGAPSYVVGSVQQACDRALREALTGVSLEGIARAARTRAEEELETCRRALDGKNPSGLPYEEDWWLRWGYRTITRAWRDAEQLARFRDALARADVSHVTSGHPVMPNSYHVYAVDRTSPSGCLLIVSADHDLPGISSVLGGRSTAQGGARGSK